MSGLLSKRDDFTASIFVLPAVFFCCVHLKVRVFALTCVRVVFFFFFARAEMQRGRQGKRVSHSTLSSAHSDAWQMIRNGFY